LSFFFHFHRKIVFCLFTQGIPKISPMARRGKGGNKIRGMNAEVGNSNEFVLMYNKAVDVWT
jgi:hypothetical protein